MWLIYIQNHQSDQFLPAYDRRKWNHEKKSNAVPLFSVHTFSRSKMPLTKTLTSLTLTFFRCNSGVCSFSWIYAQFQWAPGVCSFCWNFTERQILWSLCSVDFHTLTLQLPIQTPHSVAPELQVFVSSLKISAKRAHPRFCGVCAR